MPSSLPKEADGNTVFAIDLSNFTAFNLIPVESYGSTELAKVSAFALDGSFSISSGSKIDSLLRLPRSDALTKTCWGWLLFDVVEPALPTKRLILRYKLDVAGAVRCEAFLSDRLQPVVTAPDDSSEPGGIPVGRSTPNSENGTVSFLLNNSDIPLPLKPSTWMTDLVKLKPEVKDWPISRFKLPGSHDACTYGNSKFPWTLFRFNWHCQKLDLAGQHAVGHRAFDLRIKGTGDAKKPFQPFHGAATPTGNKFSRSPSEVGRATLLETIRAAAESNPGEIYIYALTFGSFTTKDAQKNLVTTLYNLAGDLLYEQPQDGSLPTYQQMIDSGKNVIMAAHGFKNFDHSIPEVKAFLQSGKIWKMEKDGNFVGNQELLYNSFTWKMGELPAVLKSTQEWVQEHRIELESHEKLWIAQFQLTPSLSSPFNKKGIDWKAIADMAHDFTVSPECLAKKSNPKLKALVPSDATMLKTGNIMQFDFADERVAAAIIGMNWFA